MDHRNVPPPKTTDHRYELISGGESNRVLLYVARRKLGLSVEEWYALPWWQQRMYIDGMMAEGVIRSADEDDEYGDFDDEDPVTASDAALRRMGLSVIDGG